MTFMAHSNFLLYLVAWYPIERSVCFVECKIQLQFCYNVLSSLGPEFSPAFTKTLMEALKVIYFMLCILAKFLYSQMNVAFE